MSKKEPKYAGSIAIDFWPPRDWFRFHVDRHWHPGQCWQMFLGPIRIDIFAF